MHEFAGENVSYAPEEAEHAEPNVPPNDSDLGYDDTVDHSSQPASDANQYENRYEEPYGTSDDSSCSYKNEAYGVFGSTPYGPYLKSTYEKRRAHAQLRSRQPPNQSAIQYANQPDNIQYSSLVYNDPPATQPPTEPDPYSPQSYSEEDYTEEEQATPPFIPQDIPFDGPHEVNLEQELDETQSGQTTDIDPSHNEPQASITTCYMESDLDDWGAHGIGRPLPFCAIPCVVTGIIQPSLRSSFYTILNTPRDLDNDLVVSEALRPIKHASKFFDIEDEACKLRFTTIGGFECTEPVSRCWEEENEDEAGERLTELVPQVYPDPEPEPQSIPAVPSRRAGRGRTRRRRGAKRKVRVERVKSVTPVPVSDPNESVGNDEIDINELALSSAPASGSENCLSLSDGSYLRSHFFSNAKLLRDVCYDRVFFNGKNSVDADLPLKYGPMAFPPVKEVDKQIEKEGAVYWLFRLIDACKDYKTCYKVVESGEFHATLLALKDEKDPSVIMALLTVTRLVMSYRGRFRGIIKYCREIYDFIFSVLGEPKKYYKHFCRLGTLNGRNKAYSRFIASSLGAHFRPLRTIKGDLPFNEQVEYEEWVQMFVSKYEHCFLASRRGESVGLSEELKQHYDNLTTHEMARDIFVDLARHNLWKCYGSKNIYVKWVKTLIRHFKETSPSGYRDVLMYWAVISSPRMGVQIPPHFTIFNMAFSLVKSFISQMHKRHVSGLEKPEPSNDLAIMATESMKLLKTIQQLSDSHDASNFFSHEMYISPLTLNVVHYLLEVPFDGKVHNMPHFREFYEVAWAFVASVHYSFPRLHDRLINFACDKNTPISLRGQAVIALATFILTTRNQLSSAVLGRLVESMSEYAMVAPTAKLRYSRCELAFRLDTIRKEGIFSPPTRPPSLQLPSRVTNMIFECFNYYSDMGPEGRPDADTVKYMKALSELINP